MSKKLHQIFKNIKQLEPSASLEWLILQRINSEKLRQQKNKLVWSIIGFAGSVLAAVVSIYFYGQALWQSEFMVLVKLFLSDASLVLIHWQEFGFSLLETLPVFSIIAILLPIFLCLWFMGRYFEVNKNNQHHFGFRA